jgi:glycosyltransferase involved in cell wall biosynthesis
MVSFQAKLSVGLNRLGIEVTTSLDERPYQAVLVIGGTRQLAALWRARQAGIPIVQRLDGRNWLHRRRPVSRRLWLRAEYGNWLLRLIRDRLADRVVYQSQFSRFWWERDAGPTRQPDRVIYNGVDLSVYSPHGKGAPPAGRCRVLLVEGSLMGGYELGLEHALALVQQLREAHQVEAELMVVGRAAEGLRDRVQAESQVPVIWQGLMPRDKIPEIDRSAHLLFSGDLNPACPNAVIEALACGLPVLAFDTGALGELVGPQSGRVVPYGGDPWKLDRADIPALAAAAQEILVQRSVLQAGARQRAEKMFGLDEMVAQYVEYLLT